MGQKKIKQHRRQVRQEILKTIWCVPDDVWPELQKLLPPPRNHWAPRDAL